MGLRTMTKDGCINGAGMSDLLFDDMFEQPKAKRSHAPRSKFNIDHLRTQVKVEWRFPPESSDDFAAWDKQYGYGSSRKTKQQWELELSEWERLRKKWFPQ